MKLNMGKRILIFFHWLFSVLICAAFAAYIIKPDWTLGIYHSVADRFASTHVMIIGIAILAIYVILSMVEACIIFQRTRGTDRGFITVDSSDSGKVRIAVSAIEQMVRQSVISIDGITDMKIGIESRDDAIAINITATLQNGCHVPTITVNMQRAIRQFVEMNCGVAVRSVSISINAVTNAGEGGRRWGRRKDDIKPVEMSTPVYAPVPPQPDISETPVAPVIEPEGTAVEPEPVHEETESAHDPVFIPDPEPIRLHFDHIPEPASEDDVETPVVTDEEQ